MAREITATWQAERGARIIAVSDIAGATYREEGPDVFTAGNAGRVRAKVILQGADIPTTAEAEEIFHRRGILSVPDVIANAGGVIRAAVEQRGGSRAQAFAAIEEKIAANTAELFDRLDASDVPPRAAATAMAVGRLRAAGAYRRPF